jgi:hypothetical protein
MADDATHADEQASLHQVGEVVPRAAVGLEHLSRHPAVRGHAERTADLDLGHRAAFPDQAEDLCLAPLEAFGPALGGDAIVQDLPAKRSEARDTCGRALLERFLGHPAAPPFGQRVVRQPQRTPALGDELAADAADVVTM